MVHVLLFSTLCLSTFAIISDGEVRSGCVDLTVFLMSYETQCSVALPRGAM